MELVKLKDIKATFANVVKITQVGDLDYIIHLYNTYSGKRWVFKIYKLLFDKGMEIRRMIPLEIITSEEAESQDAEDKGVKIYS